MEEPTLVVFAGQKLTATLSGLSALLTTVPLKGFSIHCIKLMQNYDDNTLYSTLLIIANRFFDLETDLFLFLPKSRKGRSEGLFLSKVKSWRQVKKVG